MACMIWFYSSVKSDMILFNVNGILATSLVMRAAFAMALTFSNVPNGSISPSAF